jgi:hypothetical protein
MKPNNPFTNWANEAVYKQINNCIEKQYLQNTTIDEETKKILIADENDKIKLKKLMNKIIKEKTYEDEKKQYAIRSACNDMMYMI